MPHYRTQDGVLQLAALNREIMKGFGLYILAVIMTRLFNPIGFIWSILRSKNQRYFVHVAVARDQKANVVWQGMLNDLFIKPDGYKAGNIDETISSVLGKNERDNTLTGAGKFLVWLLNKLDKDHCIKSIEEKP